MPLKSVWTPATIAAAAPVSDHVRLIEIAPYGGPHRYGPGAHIDVAVMIAERPETRSYTLVGPARPGAPYRIAVKMLEDSRGGSRYMHALKEGANVMVSQPKNDFELDFSAPRYLLVAGGIGITPIYSMALALAEKGADFRLLYAGHSLSDMPFAAELREKLGSRVELFVSDQGRRIDIAGEIEKLDSSTQLYLCGPVPMLDAARAAWHRLGKPAGNLRYETFGASGHFAPQAFKVKIPRLDLELDVPANQSVLEVLEKAGVDVISDCRRGECGTCIVDIVSATGTVDHRDMFFSDAEHAENKKMCICVSRVVDGDLVLDTSYRAD
ncbi:MAG: oxidoreductase [Rhodobiaceae bacterium]|nr:oxidoreductase [Rhodobiaceae bacterium]